MYVVSHEHKCPKCGHTEKAGGSDMDYWKKSPITAEGNPICPHCWNKFLDSLGAEMRCTVAWTKAGSDYDYHYGNRKAITADLVMRLRDVTDAPMMECKKALTATNGDFEKAKEWIRVGYRFRTYI